MSSAKEKFIIYFAFSFSTLLLLITIFTVTFSPSAIEASGFMFWGITSTVLFFTSIQAGHEKGLFLFQNIDSIEERLYTKDDYFAFIETALIYGTKQPFKEIARILETKYTNENKFKGKIVFLYFVDGYLVKENIKTGNTKKVKSDSLEKYYTSYKNQNKNK